MPLSFRVWAALFLYLCSSAAGQQEPAPALLFPNHSQFGLFLLYSSFVGEVSLLAGVEQTVWDVQGESVDWSQSGVVSIVSTSTEDNPSGSGAGSVRVFGSNVANFLQAETVELNGVTPVLTAGVFLSPLDRIEVVSLGATALPFGHGIAAGQITAQVDSVNAARIAAGNSRSHTAAIRIPVIVEGQVNTSVIDAFNIFVGQLITSMPGNVEVQFWLKRGDRPFTQFMPPVILPTANPDVVLILKSQEFVSGDLLEIRAVSSVPVNVGFAFRANTYGPIAVGPDLLSGLFQ